ncbi:hypothetical protein DDE18_21980 [Nocardioides gansuensis]|uniref:YdbS-like PH domain-containing protein n=1 Tax=Nocardioides gansuensis TaxID=2138300 RepID=A0A2T8F4N1_9ACTN|nr:PH domain-containing protein [Nocardioides gansuensis]PVG80672.1 hypothetical protein DDE18_21980 [Nocardioides gansuensis]
MTDLGPEPWLRLDPRMLLVHPVREVVRFLPALVGLLVAGGASGAGAWTLLGVVVPVGLGVVRYLTTSYRIAAGRVELRRGLLRRHTLSTPIDRVRTVDLSATLVHRVLGLSTVVLGTGSVSADADERLELDALPQPQAVALRGQLLQAGRSTESASDGTPATALPSRTVARFEPRWLWYAPFTGAGLVAAAALIGALAQGMEMFDLRVALSEEDVSTVTGAVAVTALLTVLVLSAALAVIGYLVLNWGFTLSQEGGAWHVRRGLLTTRETSLDEARVAGVARGEPAALRLARGARLSAIATGLERSRERSILVPPAPAGIVAVAASEVLGTAAPMHAPLRPHGRAAVRRRYTRALTGSVPFVIGTAGAVAAGASVWWLLVAVVAVCVALGLARDRALALGHCLVDGFVVTRSGSLLRQRDALATGHVIGWTFRDSWFQRRVGLLTLEATTAGGRGRVGVPDVPAAEAIELADACVPGLVSQFTAPSRS